VTAAGEPQTVDELRELVALGCRVLAANGQSDWVWGHLAARDPGGRGVWMKASGYGFEEIGVDQVLLVDRAGTVCEGEGRRHMEYPIHTEIMAARPDVGAVVHSHPPHSVALAAAGARLRPVSHAGAWFVPPDVPRFEKTSDLILDAALGADVAEALGDRQALFLVNHGVVTVGPDVPTAVVRAIVLEQACQQQLLTHGFGRWATWTPPEEAVVKREHISAPVHVRSLWDYLVRRLGADG
jgi:ribulose-5-phosphate 4-epimerase/fuculose-1-phosphate aldolase